jgi:2-methylcitrate dehydratase PrpD
MDAAFDIARNAVNLRYEDVPHEVVELTKKQILDTLGVTAAASTLGQGSKEIVKLVKESGARGKSTIIGYGGRVPSWLAGFANGSMVHELDYDDLGGGGHPSACIVPTAFAVAEEVGGVNGKELIVAVAMAVDLNCRMGLAISRSGPSLGRSGWMTPPLFGYFTATVAAGRILGLTEDQMLDAIGHTLQQAAGSTQWQYSPGSVFRGIRDGFSIKGGILSALMAKRGLPGTKDSLEGKAGFFNLYYRGDYNRIPLIESIGKRFENMQVGFKPWPVCGVPLPTVDAALRLMSEYKVMPGNIENIEVSIAELSEPARAQAESLESRRRPQTIIDAKFSIPFALGVVATHGKVVIKDFTPEGLKDPTVLEMADKVTIKSDPELKNTPFSLVVAIKTKDGKQFSKGVDVPYGNAKKPIAKEDLLTKFRDCVTYSLKPPSHDDTERIIEMINNLEEIKDVSKIVRILG